MVTDLVGIINGNLEPEEARKELVVKHLLYIGRVIDTKRENEWTESYFVK